MRGDRGQCEGSGRRENACGLVRRGYELTLATMAGVAIGAGRILATGGGGRNAPPVLVRMYDSQEETRNCARSKRSRRQRRERVGTTTDPPPGCGKVHTYVGGAGVPEAGPPEQAGRLARHFGPVLLHLGSQIKQRLGPVGQDCLRSPLGRLNHLVAGVDGPDSQVLQRENGPGSPSVSLSMRR